MKLADVAYSHDNNFNLIRFLAAYAVLLSHSFVLVTGNAGDEPFAGTIAYSLGGIAVDIFFITSGFLITASLMRRGNFRSYFKARALRIYPALIIVTIFTVFLVGPMLTKLGTGEYFSNHETWKYLWKNCTVIFGGISFALPGVFEANPFKDDVNSSLWTLRFELGCYITVAFFWYLTVKLFKARHTAMIAFVAGLSIFALILFYLGKSDLIKARQSYRLYFFFFYGVSMFMFGKHIRLKHSLAFISIMLITTGVIFPKYFHYIYTPLLGYLTLYIAYVPGGFLRQFNRMGDYSYGIYIYAFLVQQALVFLIPGITVPRMILYATIITIACAMFSWHLIEKKALAYK